MAKAKKASEERPTFGKKQSRPRPMWGLAFLVISVLVLLSLWDYRWEQNPHFDTREVAPNKVGDVGLYISMVSLHYLGAVAWLVPAGLFWLSAMLFFGQSRKLDIGRYLSLIAVVVSSAILLSLIEQYQMRSGWEPDSNYWNYFQWKPTPRNGAGGWLGNTLYSDLLHKSLGELGTAVVFSVLLLAALIYLLYDNLGRALESVGSRLLDWNRARREALAARKAELQRQNNLKQAAAKANATAKAAEPVLPPKPKAAPPPPPSKPGAETSSDGSGLLGRFSKSLEKAPAPPSKLIDEAAPPPAEASATPLRASDAPKPEKPAKAERGSPFPFKLGKGKQAEPAPEPAGNGSAPSQEPAVDPSPDILGLRIIHGEVTRKVALQQPETKGDYIFPPLSLLREPSEAPPEASAEYHQQTADQLVRTLGEFGVKVTMGEVHIGPVITRYDVYPAAGVRVEKIQNLDKNLALSLKALSVRILAPVPGKGCVGVEIPNKHPQSVYIRDILESENWVNSKAEIPIALGKEVSGKPLVADLTKMPHLLIAGSTGSGKTVCINAVVTSLLYKLSPEDVRFVMVDPKIVEMQVYNSLPHMLIPVVTDPKKVPGALKYLLNEMERRYRLFASVGVRNIAGYNAKRSADKDAEARAREMDASLSPEERAAAAAATLEVPRQLDFTEEEAPIKLPYILAIVDELADLMMVAPADVETGITRLAQLARAAGIHLILATQRPSVNVITGIIKANLPSRIAFKVASKVDSRTILDAGGADQLIGRGDMLFLPPGTADLVRSQGAFVADEEINSIVAFVSENNGDPVFDDAFQRSVEESISDEDGDAFGDDEDDENGDAMIPEALEVIRTSKRASTSMLQRRLRIGYNRAARIMEILEERGYVGPENGSQPREILKDLE